MSTRRAFVAAAVLVAIQAIHVSAEQELLRLWKAPGVSVRERAAAVNRFFTNGTPIPMIVAALGTNYTRCGSSATVWLGPGPEPRKTSWLSYPFGEESVTIGTTAPWNADPVTSAFAFTGAGYSFPPVTRPTQTATNRASSLPSTPPQETPEHYPGMRDELKRGREIIRELSALPPEQTEKYDVTAFRDAVVTFIGGTAPPAATNDLLIEGGYYLRVVNPRQKDLRPHAVAWEVVVKGKIMQVLPKHKIIVLEVQEKDWFVLQTF